MSEKSQCPDGEEGKKVLDRMLIHRPRFPVNIERSLTVIQCFIKIISFKVTGDSFAIQAMKKIGHVKHCYLL